MPQLNEPICNIHKMISNTKRKMINILGFQKSYRNLLCKTLGDILQCQ